MPLSGKSVDRFLVDYQLTIEFLEPESERTIITIEQEFSLEINGKEYKLTPEKPTTLCPIFDLFRRTVKSALAFKDGRLEVEFVEGGKLRVQPHPDYEAWGITGTRGLCVVCTPGGGLAVWKPHPPEPSGGNE